ncbi:MAG: hypothetical protein JSV87_05760 [Candidatus Bathyarchaeota archaeon]|nr:MAG: hypothetical protein JSV87_05760 [Candidatus Bathyarchaeota archaeon]
MAGYVPDWLRDSHKKTGKEKVEHGKRSMPGFHADQKGHPLTEKAPHTAAAYFADGGMVYMADGRDPTEAELKQMGLDASNRERENADANNRPGIVEGFKRLASRFSEGNIDDPNSLAYERYGAGRGRREYENQKAFAENAKMQGSGMRDAGMVMRGEKEKKSEGPTVMDNKAQAVPTPKVDEVKPLSMSMDMDSMKRSAMSGGADLPKVEPNAVPRPMATEPDRKAKPAAEPKRRGVASGTTPAGGGGGSPKRGVETGTTPAEPSNSTRKEKPGARGGDNEKRKSKPYPAEQAVQNLGKRFKDADDALKADPKNAAKKKARDEAKMRYEKAAKELR